MHACIACSQATCSTPSTDCEHLSLAMCILHQSYTCAWPLTLHANMALKASHKAPSVSHCYTSSLLVQSVAFSVKPVLSATVWHSYSPIISIRGIYAASGAPLRLVRFAVLRLVTSTISLGQLPQKHRAGRQTLITIECTTPVC